MSGRLQSRTPEQVAQIVTAIAKGDTYQAVADKFNVSKSVISGYVRKSRGLTFHKKDGEATPYHTDIIPVRKVPGRTKEQAYEWDFYFQNAVEYGKTDEQILAESRCPREWLVGFHDRFPEAVEVIPEDRTPNPPPPPRLPDQSCSDPKSELAIRKGPPKYEGKKNNKVYEGEVFEPGLDGEDVQDPDAQAYRQTDEYRVFVHPEGSHLDGWTNFQRYLYLAMAFRQKKPKVADKELVLKSGWPEFTVKGMRDWFFKVGERAWWDRAVKSMMDEAVPCLPLWKQKEDAANAAYNRALAEGKNMDECNAAQSQALLDFKPVSTEPGQTTAIVQYIPRSLTTLTRSGCQALAELEKQLPAPATTTLSRVESEELGKELLTASIPMPPAKDKYGEVHPKGFYKLAKDMDGYVEDPGAAARKSYADEVAFMRKYNEEHGLTGKDAFVPPPLKEPDMDALAAEGRRQSAHHRAENET